jgi:PST family polysaccharide transporter
MRDLFFWQLIGDFFKITSWLLAFLMIAKSMTKEFIITEIGSSLLFVSLALFLVNRNGIIGITQAYFINYIIYAFTMSIMFRKTIFYNNRK